MASPSPTEPSPPETLAPISELQDYGASIIASLDAAEASLDSPENQPFSGMSASVLHGMRELRERQFQMFRRHVEIEQQYKIQNAVAEGNDVQRMSFSGIARTMRKKEAATAGLLDQLAGFDRELRAFVDQFEAQPGDEGKKRGSGESGDGERGEEKPEIEGEGGENYTSEKKRAEQAVPGESGATG